MVNPVYPNAQSYQSQAISQSTAEAIPRAILRQLPMAVELWSKLDKPNLQGDWEGVI